MFMLRIIGSTTLLAREMRISPDESETTKAIYYMIQVSRMLCGDLSNFSCAALGRFFVGVAWCLFAEYTYGIFGLTFTYYV